MLVMPVDRGTGPDEELPPQDEQPRAAVPERLPPRRKPRPGERVCGECGEGNTPVRKFCHRCGHSLAEAHTVRTPYWRRVVRRRGPKVLPAGARPRDPARSGLGHGVRRTAKFVRRGFWVVLLVFGLLAGLYPPLRTFVVAQFDHVKQDIVGAAEQTLSPRRPVSVKASAEEPGHPGHAAFDQFKNTYWAAPFDRDRQPSLTIDLGQPCALVRMIVTSGASGEFVAKHRPSIVNLAYSNEKSDTVTLKDTPEPQQLTLTNGLGAKTVRIQVLDVYRAEGATDVALTEIELFAVG